MSCDTLGPIFIAEDDADDLFMFTRLLKVAGVRSAIHVATDGQDAIERLSERVQATSDRFQPAIAFLDVKMPRLTGFEVLGWIRRRREFDPLPVVIQSGSSEPRDITMAMEMGAQCYVTKYPSPAAIQQLCAAAVKYSSDRNAFMEVTANLFRLHQHGNNSAPAPPPATRKPTIVSGHQRT